MDRRVTTSELDRILDGELSEDSDIEESDKSDNVLENDDTDDNCPSIFGDDTDEDPNYDPENDVGRPSCSWSGRRGRAVRIQSRPRPINRNVLSSSESENSDTEHNVDEVDPYKWKQINENTPTTFSHNFTFLESPGPKHCPPATAKPIDYFNLFFTQALLNLFVTETNRYAAHILADKGPDLSRRSKFLSWVNTSVTEIKAFIIVIINMGLIRKPTIKSYWSENASQSTNWFRKMLKRDRFESLLSFFHMTDNSKLPKPNEPGYDPCQKFQPLQDHCNKVFTHHYCAHEQVSIDESLIGTKSQTQLMQYIPNKHHHRWGVKLWVLCDSVTNYCLSFYCYKGKYSTEDKAEVKKHGLASVVVSKLLSFCRMFQKGYHVFTDNFYTNVPLLDYMYGKKTFMTGTVRRNRKHLPQDVKKKLDVGQKVYFRLEDESRPIVAMAYRQKKSQKKPVILLSSKPEIKDTEVSKRRHGRVVIETKPAIVQNYCQYMGGIDTHDMMLYSYLDERRSMKYWRKVAFNLFSRMILNCYVLYKENCINHREKPMNRYSFIVSVIDSVTEEWLGELQANEAASSNRSPGLVSLPGTQQKTCWVCTPKGKDYKNSRKRSRLVCARCNDGCHGTCFAKHICK